MKTTQSSLHPAGRLRTGAAILAAAEVVNTRLIRKRVEAFAEAHQTYAKAQRAVQAAEAELRACQERLAARDREQDEAVEWLARALINEGWPRANPFGPYAMPASSAIRKLPVAEEAKTIHALTEAVQRDHTTSTAVRRAAQAADEAADKTEKELAPWDKLNAGVRSTRETRDAVGRTWDLALAALKRATRAAADDGAAQLYVKLFGRMIRPKKKAAAPGQTPAPANAAQPEHTQ